MIRVGALWRLCIINRFDAPTRIPRWATGRDRSYPPRALTVDGGGTVNSKKIVVVALLCAGMALIACRRETYYEPLKLGADVPAQTQTAR